MALRVLRQQRDLRRVLAARAGRIQERALRRVWAPRAVGFAAV